MSPSRNISMRVTSGSALVMLLILIGVAFGEDPPGGWPNPVGKGTTTTFHECVIDKSTSELCWSTTQKCTAITGDPVCPDQGFVKTSHWRNPGRCEYKYSSLQCTEYNKVYCARVSHFDVTPCSEETCFSWVYITPNFCDPAINPADPPDT
jgi:hypothetical protein